MFKVLFYLFVCFQTGYLYSPGCSGTSSVDQAGLNSSTCICLPGIKCVHHHSATKALLFSNQEITPQQKHTAYDKQTVHLIPKQKDNFEFLQT